MKINRKKINSLIVIIVFFAIWETVSRLELVNKMMLPPVSEVLLTVEGLTANGKLISHIILSLGRALSGLLIAISFAVPAGVLAGGLSCRFQLAVEPVAELLSQLNPFVLYHLILIFLGIGEVTKITIIAWACIWPLFFSTISGVCHIEPVYLKLANAFKLNRWQMTVKVILPAVMPQIMYGIRMSAGYSFFMLIAAEMMGGESGLGFLIVFSQKFYQVKSVYTLVLVIAVLGVIVDGIIDLIGKRCMNYYYQEN